MAGGRRLFLPESVRPSVQLRLHLYPATGGRGGPPCEGDSLGCCCSAPSAPVRFIVRAVQGLWVDSVTPPSAADERIGRAGLSGFEMAGKLLQEDRIRIDRDNQAVPARDLLQ
jgi:hypothetical protein